MSNRPGARGWKQRGKLWLGWIVGVIAVRALGATWRIRFVGGASASQLGLGPARVVAIWHGELLPLLWAHRGRGLSVMISTHSDGEIIARIVQTLGFRPIRGSSSRGGARALLEAVALLREGRWMVFTTDGPRGPRRVCAPGVALAAARGGVPVVAVGAHVTRAWRFRSWDRFVLPKPFARIDIHVSHEMSAAGERSEDAENTLPTIQAALMAVCAPDAA